MRRSNCMLRCTVSQCMWGFTCCPALRARPGPSYPTPGQSARGPPPPRARPCSHIQYGPCMLHASARRWHASMRVCKHPPACLRGITRAVLPLHPCHTWAQACSPCGVSDTELCRGGTAAFGEACGTNTPGSGPLSVNHLHMMHGLGLMINGQVKPQCAARMPLHIPL